MKDFYILKDGKLLQKDLTVQFTNDESSIIIPLHDIDNLHLFGNVATSKRILQLFAKNNVILYYYSYSQRCFGRFSNFESNYGELIIKQSEYYLDDSKRLIIIKSIIFHAFKNLLNNVRYYLKRIPELKKTESYIISAIERLDNCKSTNEIMNLEGRVRQRYYNIFRLVIKNPDFQFIKRTYHPPKDSINALISLLNTLLYNKIYSIMYMIKLHPSIGYLHSSNKRDNSLSLDIAEIYKPYIVDRLVIRLINHKIINITHFDKEKIYLTKEGLHIVLQQFDTLLKKTITNKQKRKTVENFIKQDLINFKQSILNDKPIHFFIRRDK